MSTRQIVTKFLPLVVSFCFVHFAGVSQGPQPEVTVNTTSSYGCSDYKSSAIFYIQPGTNCSSPVVRSKENWSVISSNGGTAVVLPSSPNPTNYNSVQIQFGNPGDFTISATYDCNGSTMSTLSKSFTAYKSFSPFVSYNEPTGPICNGAAAFTATAVDSSNPPANSTPTYAWAVDNVTVPNSNSPNFNYTFSEGQTVKLTYSTSRYCASSSSYTTTPITIETTEPNVISSKVSTYKTVVNVGDPISFDATFSGIAPFPLPRTQWKVNGVNVSGHSSASPNKLVFTSWPYTGTSLVTCEFLTSYPCSTISTAGATVKGCGALTSTNLSIQNEQMLCAIKFSGVTDVIDNCNVSYQWAFGDGTTSNGKYPLHEYAAQGTYTVTLTATYNCGGCQSTKTTSKSVTYVPPTVVDIPSTVQVNSIARDNMLSAEATSFADSWDLDFVDNNLGARNGYKNGSQGVWKNEAGYVFKTERSASQPVNLATDGTFTLNMFNWQKSGLNGVPNWVRANKVTKYSPYSFELENQDVNDIFSAAIYDNNGQLPAAVGVNMRSSEMGFTSFESLDGPIGGNFTFATSISYKPYVVVSGNRNMAIVEAAIADLQNVSTIHLKAHVIDFVNSGGLKVLKTTSIVCMKAHPTNSAWTVVVLSDSPTEGKWYGSISIPFGSRANSTLTLPNIAHSGRKSLQVNAGLPLTFKQETIRPVPAKSYMISGWVSTQKFNQMTPDIGGSALGVSVIAYNKLNTQLGTFDFSPTTNDPLIEGWQPFSGTFVCPANTVYVEIIFRNSTASAAYYDDLRFQPVDGNMKGYVYNGSDYKLVATLDEDNFASYFVYDGEGNLYLTRKETKDGIKTVTESLFHEKGTN